MKRVLSVVFLLFVVMSYAQELPQTTPDDFRLEMPDILVANVSQTYAVKISDPELVGHFEQQEVLAYVNGETKTLTFENGEALFQLKLKPKDEYVVQSQLFAFSGETRSIPLWMSILPPLIAILMALVLKEVFSALFTGLLVGTTIIYTYAGNNIFIAFFKGIFAISEEYLIDALLDRGHLSIIVFSMLIGGMVNLITRNGGMKGVVAKLSRYANNTRSGQFVTWLLGIAIFFDDYANTLVVGNTMRPVTDRLKISRQKLAYIVDSTAAPIAAIAFVTTWIGAELSYIQDGISTIGLDKSPYTIFLNSLAYSFYPIFALIFILLLVWKERDFGPMYKAECRARKYGVGAQEDADGFSNKLNELEVPENIRPKAYNAIIPVVIIIAGTMVGLMYTGWDEALWQQDISFTKKLSATIGAADSYKALLWSSLSGVLVAVGLTASQKLLPLKDTVNSLIKGFRTMLTAIVILIMAWSIATVTQHMHTADFISKILIEMQMTPYLVPALTFIMAALVAFSTGSSWGTMAILYPLILPASWMIAVENGFDTGQSYEIFFNVVSSVLAGSVLGDHCSPISDTTILSSLASSCNHIEHVRTQLPYALSVGAVAIFAGTIPAAYGIPVWILFPAGVLILYFVIIIFGKYTGQDAGCKKLL